MAIKALSIRLDEGVAADLAAVARIDGVSVSEAVREAIAKHIAIRRADQDFQKRLKELIEENRELLKRLAE